MMKIDNQDKPQGEIFIITDEELSYCKEKAKEILHILPSNCKSALIVLMFLQERVESVLGMRCLGVKIKEGEA